MANNQPTFLWHDALSPYDNEFELRLKKKKRETREYIDPYEGVRFKKDQLGIFNSVFLEVAKYDDWNLTVSVVQVGHRNLKEREGERQHQFVSEKAVVRFLFVQRRSLKLYTLEFSTRLEILEQRGQNYGVVEELWGMDREVAELNLDTLCRAPLPVVQRAIISTVKFEQLRLESLLRDLESFATLRRLSDCAWSLRFSEVLTPHFFHCLSAAVGCWANVTDKNGLSMRLLVACVRDQRLHLKLGTLDTLGPRSVAGNMKRGEEKPVKVWFSSPLICHKLEVTACIDGLSAMPDLFLQREKAERVGLPLITADQLKLLKTGQGFYNVNLDSVQQRAVIMGVENALPHTPVIVIGGAGTGKSACMIETILQLFNHSVGSKPSDSIIHVVTRSNAGVKDLMAKLIDAGIPLKHIVRLMADQGELNADRAENYYHVNRYEYNEEHQLFLSTPLTMARLGVLSKVRKDGTPMHMGPPLVVCLDELGSYRMSMALAASIMSGEPVLLLGFGDPKQIRPFSLSRVNKQLHGDWTFFDVLKGSPWFYDDKERHLLNPDAGVNLVTNYRTTPYLTFVNASLFYRNSLFSGPGMTDVMFTTQLDCLQKAGIMRDVTRPLVWVPVQGYAIQDALTGSWCNPPEVAVVVDKVNAIGPIVGFHNICVVVGYNGQKERLEKAFGNKVQVKTIDDLQGQEKDYIIVSLVRCTNELPCRAVGQDVTSVGFLRNENRVISMLTRARLLTLLVGDEVKFASSGIWMWEKVIEFADFTSSALKAVSPT